MLVTLRNLRMKLLFIVLICLFPFTSAQAQDKRLVLTPAAGPLAGKTIYGDSYALLIGINYYANLPQSLWLEYAVKDVTDLREVLVESYGFPADHITVLTDNQATKANIEDALSDLADKFKVHADDRVLVFFSGHGQTVDTADGGDQGFLIPYDAKVDLADMKNAGPFLRTCIQMNTIWTYLDSSPAKHDLVIADACYSGLLASSRALDTIKPDVATEMASLRAMQVMTAGTKGQTSEELPSLGHGAFTYKLLEQLRAKATSPGEIFTASGLYQSVCSGVLELTHGKQYPKLGAHNATEGDFLFITTAPQPVPPPAVVAVVPPPAIVPPVAVTPADVPALVKRPTLTPEQQQQADAELLSLWNGPSGRADEDKIRDLTVAEVQQALNAGADIDARDRRGATLLRIVAKSGNVAVARLLLDRGADANSKDNASYNPQNNLNHGKTTALWAAASFGHIDVARLLLDKGADVDSKNVNGDGPLMVAASAGYVDVVRLLLERGADFKAKDKSGKTALMDAVGNKHDDVAAILRAAGETE